MPRIANRRVSLINQIEEVLLDSPTLTLDQIAAQTDVAIITIYRYFETREGLIRSIAEYILDELESVKTIIFSYKGDYLPTVRHTVRQYLPCTKHVRFLFNLRNFIDQRASMSDIFKKVALLRKEFYTHIVKLVKKGQREGFIRKDLPIDWIAFTVTGILFSSRDYMQAFSTKHSSIEDLLVETIVSGISK